jgi:ATP-dependent Clp protease ATP-binding subunit ClpC
MRETQLDALKRAMKPEFINRIDDIIIFRQLEKKDIDRIAEIMIASLGKRLTDRNINIEVTPKAKEFLVEKGYNQEYGARPLRRTIQKYVEDRLSEEILTGKLSIGDKVKVDSKDNEIILSKA